MSTAFWNSATVYNDTPATAVSLAQQAKLNALRYTNFLSGSPAWMTTDGAWIAADQMLSACRSNDIPVLLGLADMRNALQKAGINPYGRAAFLMFWTPLVRSFVSHKRATDGVVNGDDANIAYAAPCGEIMPPSQANNLYTAADIVNFYAEFSVLWRRETSIPLCTGGIGYVNYGTMWTDVWTKVFALPDIDICAVKTYPSHPSDAPSISNGSMLDFAVHTLAPYCASIGKPWLDEEFGWLQATPDAQRAQYLSFTFNALRLAGAIGSVVWNLADTPARATSYDVGPTNSPLAFAALQANAS